LPDLPDATMSQCPWLPDRAESLFEKLNLAPIYPQMAIELFLNMLTFLPCVASHGELITPWGQGLGGLVHEKARPYFA